MTGAPTPEDLDAYREKLAAAYASAEAAKRAAEAALDDIEEARDAARSAFGTPEATSAFGRTLGDAHLASRVLADAIDNLPALDEGAANEEEDSKSA